MGISTTLNILDIALVVIALCTILVGTYQAKKLDAVLEHLEERARFADRRSTPSDFNPSST